MGPSKYQLEKVSFFFSESLQRLFRRKSRLPGPALEVCACRLAIRSDNSRGFTLDNSGVYLGQLRGLPWTTQGFTLDNSGVYLGQLRGLPWTTQGFTLDNSGVYLGQLRGYIMTSINIGTPQQAIGCIQLTHKINHALILGLCYIYIYMYIRALYNEKIGIPGGWTDIVGWIPTLSKRRGVLKSHSCHEINLVLLKG